MSDVTIPGKDDEGQIFRELVAQFDTPAYLRRARKVEAAWQSILDRCWLEREKLLTFIRLHLATLKAQAESWDALAPFLSAANRQRLQTWHDQLEPKLRLPVPRATSPRILQRTFAELRASCDHFNRRWRRFVAEIDLTEVNRLRDGYNRYFLLEKECALRNPRLAKIGYEPMRPATSADVLAALPCFELEA